MFVRLSQTLILLSIIIGYQPVTMYLFPALQLRNYFISYLVLVCLIIGCRFANRPKVFTFTTTSLLLVAVYCVLRFVFGFGDKEDVFAAGQFLSTAIIGMVIITNPLSRTDLYRIIESICFSMAGVVLLSILAFLNEGGFNSFYELLSGVSRLGNIDLKGANSFAYQCFIGFACGLILVVKKKNIKAGLVALLICAFAILLSKSRGTIIPALFFPVALYFIHLQRAKAISFLLFFCCYIPCVSFFFVDDTFFFNERINFQMFETWGGRTDVWDACLDFIVEYPWTGVVSSIYVLDLRLWVSYTQPSGFFEYILLTPHNQIISFLVFYGVGFGGLLSVNMIYTFWRSYQYSARTTDRCLIMLPVFGFVIHLTVDVWFFLYWFVFALIAIPSATQNSFNVESQTLNTN